MSLFRTLIRDVPLAAGGAYLALVATVIAVAAISELFGRDHDRRGGGGS